MREEKTLRCGSLPREGRGFSDVLFVISNQTLQEMSTKSEFQPYLAPVMGRFAAIVSVKELAVMAIPKEKVNALDVFLQMVRNTSKLSAIVVDEANLGLPGLIAEHALLVLIDVLPTYHWGKIFTFCGFS